MQLSDVELAAGIITPHFDAVRDVFSEYETSDGERLTKLRRTRLIIDPTMHDTPRHYAGCRDDGLQILVAPEAADLPTQMLVAILAHEMGHAADFAYPGQWLFMRQDERAKWVGDGADKFRRKARKLWHDRTDDQVEWTADAIAYEVTGKPISYCGRCMVQCFEGGMARPAGLR